MDAQVTLPTALNGKLRALAGGEGRLLVMTGAGISAESGIPTFRGKDGYWTVGSKDYQPEQLATFAAFSNDPELVWAWYLYRRAVCRAAEPNAGHRAIAAIERLLQERFLLITQNVDGLHLRAGNSGERTYEIHGNIGYARCVAGHSTRYPLPLNLAPKAKGEPLTAQERRTLTLDAPCSGSWARPHVLWFDECYDEANFRFNSSLAAASSAEILLTVGSSGATNLPLQVAMAALRHGATLVDINPEENPFSELALKSGRGFHLKGSATALLPPICSVLEGPE